MTAPEVFPQPDFASQDEGRYSDVAPTPSSRFEPAVRLTALRPPSLPPPPDAEIEGAILEVLLAAAHADGVMCGREQRTVRRIMLRLIGREQLPPALERRIDQFDPAEFNALEAAELLLEISPPQRRHVLELVREVCDANNAFDLEEEQFLLGLTHALELTPADIADLVVHAPEGIHGTAKRCFDLAFSAAFLASAWPLLALLAARRRFELARPRAVPTTPFGARRPRDRRHEIPHHERDGERQRRAPSQQERPARHPLWRLFAQDFPGRAAAVHQRAARRHVGGRAASARGRAQPALPPPRSWNTCCGTRCGRASPVGPRSTAFAARPTPSTRWSNASLTTWNTSGAGAWLSTCASSGSRYLGARQARTLTEDILRRFVLIGQTASATGDFSTEDLPSTSGRLDVLLRSLRAALLVSHGLRRNVLVYLVLRGGTTAPRLLRVDGRSAKFLRPDERSLAMLVKKTLQAVPSPSPTFSEVRPGLELCAGDLPEILAEAGTTPCYVLQEGASDLRDQKIVDDDACTSSAIISASTWCRWPLLERHGCRRVSVGPVSLHSDDVVALVSNELDRRFAALADA